MYRLVPTCFKAGGPIQSISNLISNLNNDYDFWVLTSNYDLDEELNISPTELNKWIEKETYKIMYCEKINQNLFFS